MAPLPTELVIEIIRATLRSGIREVEESDAKHPMHIAYPSRRDVPLVYSITDSSSFQRLVTKIALLSKWWRTEVTAILETESSWSRNRHERAAVLYWSHHEAIDGINSAELRSSCILEKRNEAVAVHKKDSLLEGAMVRARRRTEAVEQGLSLLTRINAALTRSVHARVLLNDGSVSHVTIGDDST